MSTQSGLPEDLVAFAPRTYSVQPAGVVDEVAPVIVQAKAPAENLDYTFDLSALLAGTGDTLTGQLTFVSDNQGGVFAPDTVWLDNDDTTVTCVLSGGKPGLVVGLGIIVTTEQGRRLLIPFLLPINNASPACIPDPPYTGDWVLLTIGGFALTINGDAVAVGGP